MDEATLLELAQAAVESADGDQAEALCTEGVEAVTRFANNEIHQSMSDHSRDMVVRVVIGRRIGVASGVVNSADDARAMAATARELAQVTEELPDFVSLPGPAQAPASPVPPADDVVSATAAGRAGLVAHALATAREAGMAAAGALSTGYSAMAIANSLGVAASRSSTRAHFHVVMQAEDSAGYAAAEGPALADTRVPAVAEKAAAKARMSRNPATIEAKPMTVVLEPVAAGELIGYMAVFGFNALMYQEQQSFACDLMGQQVCAPAFSLVDDGLDPRTHAAAFDFEGVPKRRVELVKGGVISALVYDSYTAGRAEPPAENTGHAMPPPNSWGPVATNLIVPPGQGSIEDLIAGVDYGLLVSRIHYLNVVHPRQMIMTGMTREGTFLIEKGQITSGVRNLRFTERLVQALGRVAAIGGAGELHELIWTPPLAIEGFTFTSGTEF